MEALLRNLTLDFKFLSKAGIDSDVVDMTWSKWNQIKTELVAMYNTVIIAGGITATESK